MTEDDDPERPRETMVDVLEPFDNIDVSVVTGAELATELNVTQQIVLYRLNELHENE